MSTSTNSKDENVGIVDVTVDTVITDLDGGSTVTVSPTVFSLAKCLICFQNIVVVSECTSFDNSEPPENILLGFSKVFEISPTIYEGIDLASLEAPLLCTPCNEKIVESFNILREIKRLETNLDCLKSEIRDSLVGSYYCYPRGFCINKKENDLHLEIEVPSSTSLSHKNKNRIRKAFAQCWTKLAIRISSINPPVAEAEPHLKCKTRSASDNTSGRDVVNLDIEDAEESDSSGSIYIPDDHCFDNDDDDVAIIDEESCESTGHNELFDSKRNRRAALRGLKRKSKEAHFLKRINKKPRSQEPTVTYFTGDERPKSFQCEYCARVFNKEDYKLDTEDADGKAKYIFRCDLPRCKVTKPFKFFSLLKKHHLFTCKSRPTFPCEYCQRQCFSSKSLKEHVVARHWDQYKHLAPNYSVKSSEYDSSNLIRVQSFECEFCKRVFHRDDFKTESGDFLFVCDLPNCKTTKPFLSLPKLKQHHRNSCLSRPTFPCEYCPKSCYDEKTLKHHVISSHTKEFEFICDNCGLGFPTLGNLKGHLLIHSEKQHECPVCSKCFRKKFDLKLHMERHGERILCEICGKGFRCRRDLANHRFIHESEKNFPCPICNKLFKSRAYVDTHVWGTHKRLRKPRQPSNEHNNIAKAETDELIKFTPDINVDVLEGQVEINETR